MYSRCVRTILAGLTLIALITACGASTAPADPSAPSSGSNTGSLARPSMTSPVSTSPVSTSPVSTSPLASKGPAKLTTSGVTTCALVPANGKPDVTGTIYYDMNQDGRQDAGEPGLGGIALYLSRGRDSLTPGVEKSPSTCTDANGHFRITPPDTINGYRLEVRTAWFRTQCPGLTCATGGAGDNVAAGPEWVYSDPLTGAKAHVINAGLIPDAGQYVTDIHAAKYTDYPPNLSKAHTVDLTVRFTDDETTGCLTTTNGVSCKIGNQLDQTLYIGNSGMTSVSGISAVMQLPDGETHKQLVLLRTGSSPGVTGVTETSVVAPLGPKPTGQPATSANYTTIRFTVQGTIAPGGLIAVVSHGVLTSGIAGTQIIGRAGITAENNAAADTDSAFCLTPAITTSCIGGSDTHSFLDQHGDDVDSDRFNVK